MRFICLSSATPRFFARLLWIPILGVLAVGCATSQPVAPRSSIPRESALALAQQTADSVKGRVFTVAPTGSMKPTLDENSVVAVETVTYSQLRRGDIVIYRNNSGVPIIHRLNALGVSGWVVLGDNNDATDRDAVTAANLVGRVCAIFYTTSGANSQGSTAIAQR